MIVCQFETMLKRALNTSWYVHATEFAQFRPYTWQFDNKSIATPLFFFVNISKVSFFYFKMLVWIPLKHSYGASLMIRMEHRKCLFHEKLCIANAFSTKIASRAETQLRVQISNHLHSQSGSNSIRPPPPIILFFFWQTSVVYGITITSKKSEVAS